MASAAKYLSNVAKSVSYVAVDAVKAYNPVITDMAESNADVYRSVYKSIRNYRSTVKRISSTIAKSQIGEFAVDLKTNIIEDLKSGNFYNREREKKASDAALMNSDMGFGDEFGDFSVDFGDDDLSDFAVDEGSMAMMDQMDIVGEKASNAVGQVLAKTAEYQVEATRQSTIALLTQQSQMSHMINSGITTLNQNIGNLITFNNEAMSTHIENSRLFYDTTKQQLDEQTSVLKEMLELQKKIFTPNRSSSVNNKISMSDIFTSEGAINLADYFRYVQQNIKDNDMGMSDMMEMLNDAGGLKQLSSNPIGMVLTGIVQQVIPDVLKESMKSFNEAIRGGIATAFMNIGKLEDSDNAILSTIGSVFGISPHKKARLDTSKYNKEAVPWNGKDHKALTEVIPDLLGKIYSTLSGKDNKIYDYNTGRYVSKKQIKRSFEETQNMYVRNANASLIPEIENQLSHVAFLDPKERKQFLKDLDTVMKKNFDRGEYFNPKNKYMNEKYYGLKGKNAKQNMKLIREIWNKIEPEKKMQANYDLIEAISSQRSYMKSLENEGDSIYLKLFDGLDDEDPKSNKKRKNKDKKKKSEKDKEISKLKKGLMAPVFQVASKIDITNNILVSLLKTVDKIRTVAGPNYSTTPRELEFESATINDFMNTHIDGNVRSRRTKKDKKRKSSNNSDDSDGSHISKARRKDLEKTADHLLKELDKMESTREVVENGKRKFKKKKLTKEEKDRIIEGLKTSNPDLYYVISERRKKEKRLKYDNEVMQIVNSLDELYLSGQANRDQIRYELDQFRDIDPDLYKDIMKQKKRKRKVKDNVSKIAHIGHRNTNANETTMTYGGDINLDTTKPSERGKYKTSEFISDIRDADTAMGKIKAFFGGTKYLLESPAKFVGSVMKKADMRLYEVLFGNGDGDEFSITGKMMNGFEDWFENLQEKTSDTFEKIHDAITEVGIKDKVSAMFKNVFGISIDIWASEFKKAMFGKDNVSFGEGMMEVFSQGFKEMGKGFKEFFGFGPKNNDENKEDNFLYSAKNGWRDITAGRLNDKGKEKEEKRKQYDSLVRAFNANGRNKYGSIWSSSNKKKRDKYDNYNDWDLENAASGMRRVSKTGIVAVSEGEMIVPPDLNPYNIAKREKNERKAIDDFKNSIGDIDTDIPMFNTGGTARVDNNGNVHKEKLEKAQRIFSVLSKQLEANPNMSQDALLELIKKYESSDPEVYKYIYKLSVEAKRKSHKDNKYNHTDYEEGHENLAIRISDELGKMVNAVLDSDLAKSITSKLDESIGQDAKDAAKDTVLNLNKYLPTMAAAGTTGMALSLMLGLAGGPLVGGAVGASLALIKKSENVQKLLFGDKVTDEEGNTRRDGSGLLSKNLVSHIDKYFPNMAKGAIVGGITSILPFVPGGPVAGILLGSAIGFARTNENIKRTFFGGEEREKKIKEKIHKMAPKMAIGAAAMALGGPFGLTTNLLLGAGLGFVSDTEKFKQVIFGNEGLDGKRYGGIVGFIKDALEVPLEGLKKLFDATTTTLKDEIFNPIIKALEPITQQISNMVTWIGDKIHDSIKTHIVHPIGKMVTDILKPFQKLGNTIIGTVLKTIKNVALSPIKLMTAFTNKLQERQLGKVGAANNMTLEKRQQRRREIDEKKDSARDLLNKTFKTKFFDKVSGGRERLQNTDAARLDEFLSSASKEELQDFYRVQQSIDPNSGKKVNTKQLAKNFEKQLGLDKLLAAEAKFMIKGTANKIRDAVRRGDFKAAKESARNGFTDPDRAALMVKWLTNKEKDYKKLKETWAASEAKYAELVKKTGIKDIHKRDVGRTVKNALYERFGEDANATLSEQLAKEKDDEERKRIAEEDKFRENIDKHNTTVETALSEATRLLNAIAFPDSDDAKQLRKARQRKEDKQETLEKPGEQMIDEMGEFLSSGPKSKSDLIKFINKSSGVAPWKSNEIQDARYRRLNNREEDKKHEEFLNEYNSKENKETNKLDYGQIDAVNTLVNNGDLAGARDIINGRVTTGDKLKSITTRFFNKLRRKSNGSKSVMTEHGIVKMRTNSQGEEIPDERDSETRESLERRDDASNTQRSLLQKIGGLGDGLKGLLFGKDDSDGEEEHKKGLLSSVLSLAKAGLGLFGGKGLKALGIAGGTLLAAGIAGTNVQVKKRDENGNVITGPDGQPLMETKILAEAIDNAVSHAWMGYDGTGETDGVWFKIKGFAKNTVLPGIQKLWLGDDLSGAVNGLWFRIKSLATEHIGPSIQRGMEWFITDALPGLLKTFVKTIPSLIASLLGGVVEVVKDAISNVLPWGKNKDKGDGKKGAQESKNTYAKDQKHEINLNNGAIIGGGTSIANTGSAPTSNGTSTTEIQQTTVQQPEKKKSLFFSDKNTTTAPLSYDDPEDLSGYNIDENTYNTVMANAGDNSLENVPAKDASTAVAEFNNLDLGLDDNSNSGSAAMPSYNSSNQTTNETSTPKKKKSLFFSDKNTTTAPLSYDDPEDLSGYNMSTENNTYDNTSTINDPLSDAGTIGTDVDEENTNTAVNRINNSTTTQSIPETSSTGVSTNSSNKEVSPDEKKEIIKQIKSSKAYANADPATQRKIIDQLVPIWNTQTNYGGTIGDLLNSDAEVGSYTDESGNLVSITGADILNYPQLSQMIGVDSTLTNAERQEQKEKMGLDIKPTNWFTHAVPRAILQGKRAGKGLKWAMKANSAMYNIAGKIVKHLPGGKGPLGMATRLAIQGTKFATNIPGYTVNAIRHTSINMAEHGIKGGLKQTAKDAKHAVVDSIFNSKSAQKKAAKAAKRYERRSKTAFGRLLNKGTDAKQAAKEAAKDKARNFKNSLVDKIKGKKGMTSSSTNFALVGGIEDAASNAAKQNSLKNKAIIKAKDLGRKAKGKIKGSKIADLITKFKKVIEKFFTNGKVVGIFKKAAEKLPFKKKAAKKMSKGTMKKVLKKIADWMIDRFTKQIGHKAAKAVAQVSKKLTQAIPIIGQVATIAFIVYDFLIGLKNADMIFGVQKPTWLQRFIAGVINAICENLTFNLFFSANDVIEIFVKVLEAFGCDMSKLREQQEEADSARDEFNDKWGTNLSTTEYLAKDKIGSRFKRALTKINPFASEEKKENARILDEARKADKNKDTKIYETSTDDAENELDVQEEKTATETILESSQYDDTMNDAGTIDTTENEESTTYASTVERVSALDTGIEEGSGVVTSTSDTIANSQSIDYSTNNSSSISNQSWNNNSVNGNVNVDPEAIVSGTGSIITPQNQVLIQQSANEINASIPGMVSKMKQNIAKYLGIDTYELTKHGKNIGKDRFSDVGGPRQLMKNIIKMWSKINSIVAPLTGNLPMTMFYAVKGLKSFLANNFDMSQAAVDEGNLDLSSMMSNNTSINSQAIPSSVVLNNRINEATSGSDSQLSTALSTITGNNSRSSNTVTPSTKGRETSLLGKIAKGAKTAFALNPLTAPIALMSKLFGKGGSGSGIAGTSSSDGPPQSDPDIDNFISQKYSSYANKKFTVNGDKEKVTVKDAGCAPAVATMVINSSPSYSPITMDQAIKDSLEYKQPDGGVTADYFVDEFSKHNMVSTFITNRHANMKQNIINHIRRGKKVILMGSDSRNKSKRISPFGPTDHYVVATGVNEDGSKIYVNDPEARKPKIEYDTNSVLNNVKIGVIPTVKNKRKAPMGLLAKARRLLSKFSGKGPRTIIYVGDSRMVGMLGDGIINGVKYVAKGAMGYDWLKNQEGAIKEAIQTSTNPVLVFNFGVNDLDNYNKYNVFYSTLRNNKMKKVWMNGVKMYFLSVNPIKDWHKSPYGITNEKIETFNKMVARNSAFDGYIDTYSTMKSTDFDSQDGIHYLKNTNQWIHQQVINVLDGGKVSKNGPIGNGRSREGTYRDKDGKLRDKDGNIVNEDGSTSSDSSSSSGDSSSNGGSGDEGGIISPVDYLNNMGEIHGINGFLATLDALAAAYGLTVLSSGSGGGDDESGDGSGSGGDTGVNYSKDGISGRVSSDKKIAEKQVKVLATMKSKENKLNYVLGGHNFEDGGGADCSSTIQWAYQTALGVDVGGWTGAQETNSNTYHVDEPHGREWDESKMQLGDLVLFGSNAGSHVEMYHGNGTFIGHGGPGVGPHVVPIYSNSCGGTWSVKRLNEFKSKGTSNYDASSDKSDDKEDSKSSSSSKDDNKSSNSSGSNKPLKGPEVKKNREKIISTLDPNGLASKSYKEATSGGSHSGLSYHDMHTGMNFIAKDKKELDQIKKEVEAAKKKANITGGKGSGLPDFVSQLDSKYKNIQFGDETIAEAGCAPVVATMAESAYASSDNQVPNLRSVIKRAKQYKAEGEGVTGDFFIDEFERNGYTSIVTRRIENIYNSLRQNKPVVLLGQDERNKSKKRSPFGPTAHYVLATGISNDGNTIYIHDPEARRGYIPYKTSSLVNAIQFGIRPILKGANTKADTLMRSTRSILSDITGNAAKKEKEKDKKDSTKSKKVSSKYGSETPQYIVWNVLRANGYKEVATAAVMGNIEAECHFNVGAEEVGGGGGYGLIQWTGTRRTDLENFAASKGGSVSDIKIQTEFLIQELNGGQWINGGGPSYGFRSYNRSDWENAKEDTIDDATKAFMCCYERPSYDPGTNHYELRCTAAREYYNEFTGSDIDTSLNYGSSGSSDGSGENQNNTKKGSSEPKIIEMINKFDELAEKYGLIDEVPEVEGGSSSSSGGSSSDSGGVVSGANGEEQTWNYFRSRGFTAEGTAGMMGNIQHESGFKFNNVENLLESKLGTTDEQYTADVDSGAISKELFLAPRGPGTQYGYGLVQWTSAGIKGEMYDYTKGKGKSIADPGGQMDCLYDQLKNQYNGLYNVFTTTNDIQEASNQMLHGYERPADQSYSVEIARGDAGRAIYEKYKDFPVLSGDRTEVDSDDDDNKESKRDKKDSGSSSSNSGSSSSSSSGSSSSNSGSSSSSSNSNKSSAKSDYNPKKTYGWTDKYGRKYETNSREELNKIIKRVTANYDKNIKVSSTNTLTGLTKNSSGLDRLHSNGSRGKGSGLLGPTNTSTNSRINRPVNFEKSNKGSLKVYSTESIGNVIEDTISTKHGSYKQYNQSNLTVTKPTQVISSSMDTKPLEALLKVLVKLLSQVVNNTSSINNISELMIKLLNIQAKLASNQSSNTNNDDIRRELLQTKSLILNSIQRSDDDKSSDTIRQLMENMESIAIQ